MCSSGVGKIIAGSPQMLLFQLVAKIRNFLKKITKLAGFLGVFVVGSNWNFGGLYDLFRQKDCKTGFGDNRSVVVV